MTDLLDLIDNDIRRKMLSILSIRPSYTFELARSVGTSQQLIAKHLKLLENNGLVYRVGKINSEEGPQRILYRANAPLLSLLQFIENISNFEGGKEDIKDNYEDLEELIRELRDTNEQISAIELELRKLITRQQNILVRIYELANADDSTELFKAFDSALRGGDFRTLMQFLNRRVF
ncbi:MAG: ArsR family transcriptional regulator [Candidatus Thermoplasmatota archaeon]|jgi:predicted transcriptional regulator|nr:ArsR family transcriptional regulator [Candidatus Thermoplasmatota archaeon]